MAKHRFVYTCMIGDKEIWQEIRGGECFVELQEKLHYENAAAVLNEKEQLTEDGYDTIMKELAELYIAWYEAAYRKE
jgi:hypothetical protein